MLIVVAGLYGAAGVGLAAAAAHLAVDASLATAANFLLFGAAGIGMAAALAVVAGRPWSFAEVGGGLLAVGTALFSGAIAARVLAGMVIFPMAAPTGGTMLMAGWLVIALAGLQRGAKSS
nr:DUF423 domain-containing protein [Ancylobacter lacus]